MRTQGYEPDVVDNDHLVVAAIGEGCELEVLSSSELSESLHESLWRLGPVVSVSTLPRFQRGKHLLCVPLSSV
jgi:hypothetical protein